MRWPVSWQDKKGDEARFRELKAFPVKEITIMLKDKSFPQTIKAVDLPTSGVIGDRLYIRTAGGSGDWVVFNFREVLFYRVHDTNETEGVFV